jgi:hypothetical protein
VGDAPVAVFVTVAVKLTDCPYMDGFSDELTAVIVLAAVTVTMPLTYPIM